VGNSFSVKTAEKNSCKGNHGEKIEQVLSSTQVLSWTLKKLWHKLLPTKQKPCTT